MNHVFGSAAAGTDTARSDIDLLIIGREITCADTMRALAAPRWCWHRSEYRHLVFQCFPAPDQARGS